MTEGKTTRFWTSLAELYEIVGARNRRAIEILIALTIGSAFSEILAIGSVVPFLALLAGVASPSHLPWIDPIFAAIGVRTAHAKLLAASVLLCAAAASAGIFRVLLIRKTLESVSAFGHRLLVEVQRRMLLQPYSWHVRNNSSKQLATLEKVELVTSGVLLPLTEAFAAIVLIAVLVLVLLRIAPLATVLAGAMLGAAYYALGLVARGRLETYSARIDRAFEDRIKILQEGLGGIRDLILDSSQEGVLDRFRMADLELARARARSIYISSAPRYLIEPIGIVVIAGLAVILSAREGGLPAALPILGALALGAQRLLPLVQQLFQGWSSISANRYVIEDVVARLRLPIPATASPAARLSFERLIEFRDVSYKYADRMHRAVTELSFDIRHGSRVGLVGRTGCGKSTTADLVMGLLDPSAGKIVVDGVTLTDENRPAWRANVANVPQMLFVSDATIAENIALASTVDMDRVREAAALVQLDTFVASLPQGYETRVGERGAQLSGGQRQRLAIARAIYKDALLLVLDEATNALDQSSEAAVLAALDEFQKRGRTILIVAHRESMTATCDRLLRLEDGRLLKE